MGSKDDPAYMAGYDDGRADVRQALEPVVREAIERLTELSAELWGLGAPRCVTLDHIIIDLQSALKEVEG